VRRKVAGYRVLVLHQSEVSPFCDKVRRILHYKRRHYETHEVPPTETLVRLRRLNPVGKVPVLEHGANVISDSSEIARYLDRTFPEPPIFPDEERDRALCHVFEDWADESLYFFEVFFRFGLPENADEWSRRTSHSEPPLIRRATEAALPTLMRNLLRAQGLGRRSPGQILEEFERHLRAIDVLLGGHDWLFGGRLSIADIAAYSQLACAGETAEGAAILADHLRLMAWMERVNGATTKPI
jgi:glutathione S-transferase